ncbi:MAG TPA: 4-(cytidine 5'-diphospho)-2-C-methyl-D-erythritol kinase [Caulobacteraceae bacterium]
MTLTAFAPAKVNLCLHVGPVEADGYHPVSSLAVFADVGDVLTATPAAQSSLRIDGPFAQGLSTGADNLVLRALDAVGASAMDLRLDKRLPVASGLGGGTSDAGAALRLAQRLDPRLTDADLERAAASLGADGPLCLWRRPALAEGRGERLTPAPALPLLHAVLVNPGAACATGAVYAAFDEGGPCRLEPVRLPSAFADFGALIAFLAGMRNDLEAPARRLQPAVGAVLDRLSAMPQAQLARMSGSGATCFALCRTAVDAEDLARMMSKDQPGWWVEPCRLGGPQED